MTQNRFYSSATRPTVTTADPGTSGTSLAVADSTAFSSLDGSFPYTVAINWGAADQELVSVTGRPDSTHLTIVRGQDGTAGVAHPVGATVTHDVSARDFNEAGAHVGASTGVHGLTGTVVGTTDPQTLTNKTITSPSTGGPMLVPSLSVGRSSAFSLSGTSLTAIPWDTEDYQDNVTAGAMHSTSTNPTRMIAPIPGKYLLVATVEVQSNAAAPYLQIKFRLNGLTDIKWSTGPGVASKTNNISLVSPWKMVAGDYVEVFASSTVSGHALQVVGTSTTYASMSYLSG